jgi:hypothetical protein
MFKVLSLIKGEMVWVLLEKKDDLEKKKDMKVTRFQIIERERGLICNKRKPMTSKLSQVQCATKKTNILE